MKKHYEVEAWQGGRLVCFTEHGSLDDARRYERLCLGLDARRGGSDMPWSYRIVRVMTQTVREVVSPKKRKGKR